MSKSTHDRLLELLERAASSSGLVPERADHERRRRAELEALRAERLIELRGGAYRATATGIRALHRRGRASRLSDFVAVMFTDLVGSTQLIERLGEATAHAVVRRHFELLRNTLVEYRGHEVKSLGDGLMVVFVCAADAVACAAAMQAAAPGDGLGLGLRIGIHAGETVQDDGDYFGTTVVLARRLCDAAPAAGTFVSERVAELVAEHRFEPLGHVAVKGFTEPVFARAA